MREKEPRRHTMSMALAFFGPPALIIGCLLLVSSYADETVANLVSSRQLPFEPADRYHYRQLVWHSTETKYLDKAQRHADQLAKLGEPAVRRLVRDIAAVGMLTRYEPSPFDILNKMKDRHGPFIREQLVAAFDAANDPTVDFMGVSYRRSHLAATELLMFDDWTLTTKLMKSLTEEDFLCEFDGEYIGRLRRAIMDTGLSPIRGFNNELRDRKGNVNGEYVKEYLRRLVPPTDERQPPLAAQRAR